MLRPISLTIVVATCAALSGRAQAPATAPQQPAPTFRVGVDVVQLDVTVLDKSRRPVRGLTAADFTVVEAGHPRPIVAFTPIEIPPPTPPSAPWMRDVAADVVVNNADIDRILVIVMDDAWSGRKGDFWDPWILGAGKQIAREAIKGLGPKDLGAVVYTYMGRTQNLTADRSKLLAAVDKFQPRNSPSAGPPLGCTYGSLGSKLIPDCIVNTLRSVAEALPETPPRRKVILFVSQYDQAGEFDDADMATPLMDLFRAMQRSNTTIYAYSPGGLQVDRSSTSSSLRTLAENTGGRAVADSNAPWEEVPALFNETNAYYMLGVQTAAVPSDGHFHGLSIRVNRRDVDVLARKGYYAPPKPSKRLVAQHSPIDTALAGSFPASGLAIGVSAAVFAAHDPHRADVGVIVGVGLGDMAAGAARRIDVVVKAFDQNWKERASRAQAVEATTTAVTIGTPIEVFSRLTLAPGRYELRVAAEGAGRMGSVFTDLEVPDYSSAPLSASGLVIADTRPGRTNALSDLAGGAPTMRRAFAATESVAAFVRIYEGGKKPIAPVPIHVTVVDALNQTVVNDRTSLDPGAFASARAADFRFDVPLARLGRGEHLLTVEIGNGNRQVVRTARFTVR